MTDNYLESLKAKLELFRLAQANKGLLNASEEQINKSINDLEQMIKEYTESKKKAD